MRPRSARVERPFPTLSIPCGCEAYPRDLLVDCVWFKRAFTLVSESGDITIATACGDTVVVVILFPGLYFLHHVMYSVDYFHRSLPVLYVRFSFHVLSTTS